MSSGRFEPYKAALKALSVRTGTPLSSLLLSFGVLHEITALVPLVGVFYGARTFGLGEAVIGAIVQNNPGAGEEDRLRGTLRSWVEEGDKWASRVGQHYGVFGFEKRTSQNARNAAEHPPVSDRIAGDVANAVVAYGVTKVNAPITVPPNLGLILLGYHSFKNRGFVVSVSFILSANCGSTTQDDCSEFPEHQAIE
jgi:hypothetical protein